MASSSDNWNLLVRLCKLLSKASSTKQTASRFDTDQTKQLVSMAREHHCVLYLDTVFEQLSPEWTGSIEGLMIKEELRYNVAKNLRFLMDIGALAKLMNDRHVRGVFLKGSAYLVAGTDLARKYRQQVDIDVLIPIEHLRLMGDALRSSLGGMEWLGGADEGGLSDPSNKDEYPWLYHHHYRPVFPSFMQSSVEIHRSNLPIEFSHLNLSKDLLETYQTRDNRGVKISVPSPEHQIIQIVLGNFSHDGYLYRFMFPFRPLLDYFDVVVAAENNEYQIDYRVVDRVCGWKFTLFRSLYYRIFLGHCDFELSRFQEAYLCLVKARYDYHLDVVFDVLDRIRYLSVAFFYAPAKLNHYLKKKVGS